MNIKKIQLTIKEKFEVLYQLFSIIEYFHKKNLVYRDLRPNNIIIDINKTLVLLDFDRLINNSNHEDHTNNLTSLFIAPEISLGLSTKKAIFIQ